MIQSIIIPGWHPARLNSLLGNHHAAGRLKSKDRDIVGRACVVHQLARATGKRRVELWIVMAKGKRSADGDAFWKSALDSLVHAGALKNDSHHWCQVSPVRFLRSESDAGFSGSVIILEDMIG